MPYDPRAIANYFIDLASPEDDLTPMKVQKLVYYAHGWQLALTGEPLIDEQVEAWPFGPVIPSLWRAFRAFGDGRIDRRAEAVDFDDRDNLHYYEPSLADEPDELDDTRALLDRVWDLYGRYSGIQLSNLTHMPGTPWEQTLRRYRGKLPKGTDIPPETIEKWFSERLLETPA